MADRLCSIDGCGKTAHARGLCPMHYQRQRLTGTVDLVSKPRKPRAKRVGVEPCEIEGCDKLMVARGWCTAHWTRWKRHGSPTARLRGEVIDGRRICATCRTDKPVEEFGRPSDAWCRPCANAYQLAYKNQRYIPKPTQSATCAQCGVEFMANKKRYIFCSAECDGAGRYKRNAKYVQARRARQRAVTVEAFYPGEVYQRDNWSCGLCHEPIDREAVAPHPLSRSIDHIVPISRGGEHSLRNVQAAHLGCNVKKGNRVEAAA